MELDAKMNSFTWFRKDIDWVVLGDQYNKTFILAASSMFSDDSIVEPVD